MVADPIGRETERMMAPVKSEDSGSICSTQSIESKKIIAPPDGGWGWVIVLAAFMCAFMIDGVTNSFGVFYVEFLEYYNADKAVTSLGGSLICGCFLTFGAISGPLVSRFGCRLVTFVGGIVTSAALVICTFSPNIETFLITYGCLAGVGLGLVYVPSMLIVNFYFDKKRGIASGIVTSGAGLGVVVMAKLSESLLKEYGWKGAHIIIAGVALNLCVCAALFRPLKLKLPVPPSIEDSWETCADELVIVDEQSAKDDSNSIHLNAAWSPIPSPRLQVVNNCLYSSNYTSLPAVALEDKSHYFSVFQAKTDLTRYANTNPAKETYRSTEVLNRLKAFDDAPARLSTSMFTVNTPAALETKALVTVKKPTKMVTMSPLVRKDIFFSGSVMSLEQFRSQPDMKHYIASITVEQSDERVESRKNICTKTPCSNLDLSLFKSMTFNIICVSSMLIQIAGFIPPFYLGNYAVSVGLEASSVSTFLACMGFSCIPGRLLSGALASWKPDQCLNIMAISLTLTGVACALYPVCQTFLHLCIMSALFGFLIGFFPPVQPILLVRYLGLDKLSASFGLCTGLKGLATMVGPPIAGILLESTGTFVAPFCFGGVCLIVSGVIYWLVPFLEPRPDSPRVILEVEVASCDSGSQTEESVVDSDEERSRKGSLPKLQISPAEQV